MRATGPTERQVKLLQEAARLLREAFDGTKGDPPWHLVLLLRRAAKRDLTSAGAVALAIQRHDPARLVEAGVSDPGLWCLCPTDDLVPLLQLALLGDAGMGTMSDLAALTCDCADCVRRRATEEASWT